MEEARRIITEWLDEGSPDVVLELAGLGLTELPELPDELTILDCSRNQITKLPDKLPDRLTELYCHTNQLNKLPQLPDRLTTLDCDNNQLQYPPSEIVSYKSLQEIKDWMHQHPYNMVKSANKR